jgi:unsaturated chondroitin disaccharide hydrolase
MSLLPNVSPVKPRLVALCGWAVCAKLAALDISGDIATAWTVAEQRSEGTMAWMDVTYGSPLMYSKFPTVGDHVTGRWELSSFFIRDWRSGFWPGTLWLLAQRTGSDVWRQRAMDWSASLALSENLDHDIGFITLASLGKGMLYHDDLTDPGGAYREFAKTAITRAAGKLDARFNQANVEGTPVVTGFTRSWNSPYENPYPVCVDNLMNLEVLFLAYELNGRPPSQRVWFEHGLTHARTSIAQHLRADGGTYHVVKHFESGPRIGQIERKNTVQGYGDETTWSRGQAWAIHGLASVYRFARRDPETDASDILAAARATADYFLARLPDNHAADPYNHRPGDFVPPSDFDAALGEPSGPWNDANNDYDSASGTGLGDHKPALQEFTLRDSSAAAIAASGLIELAGQVPDAADRARYLAAAEAILHCLIAYDGPDADSSPDYLCAASETTDPGILKAGSVRWGEANRSLIYGDFYFLEALARYEALGARELLARSQRVICSAGNVSFEFEMTIPAPTLALRVQKCADLDEGNWATVAAKTGAGPWSGISPVAEEILPAGRVKVRIADLAPGTRGFFRILTRSLGGDGP